MADTKLYLIFFTVLNIFLISNTQYVGNIQGAVNSNAILRRSVELICEYTGSDGHGQFVGWFKDDTNVKDEKQGHYVVKNTEKESRLIIKIFVEDDSNVNQWHVTTNKPGYESPTECQFGPISVTSSPQSMETDREKEKLTSNSGSIRRIEDESIFLKCIIEPRLEDSDTMNNIRWQFSRDEDKFSQVPDGVIVNGNKLSINQVKKIHRGYYRCVLNDISFTVLLRVKDRLAALWPFLGIVSVVLILVLIILIFEKRQRSAKKAAGTDDDDHAHANDALLRSTSKSSDNENKKRAVKA